MLVAVLTGLLVAMTACGRADGDDPRPHPLVEDREPLPSCGTEDLRGGSAAELVDRDARRCLIAAWEAGRPAELVSIRPNVEGKPPVTQIVRVVGRGRLEVFRFANHGGVADGFWMHSRCTNLLYGDDLAIDSAEAELRAVTFIHSNCEARRLEW